jgi:hypothetical protein
MQPAGSSIDSSTPNNPRNHRNPPTNSADEPISLSMPVQECGNSAAVCGVRLETPYGLGGSQAASAPAPGNWPHATASWAGIARSANATCRWSSTTRAPPDPDPAVGPVQGLGIEDPRAGRSTASARLATAIPPAPGALRDLHRNARYGAGTALGPPWETVAGFVRRSFPATSNSSGPHLKG